MVAGAILVVLSLLVVTQLVLPGVAERRLRDDLAEVGRPERVEVEAFPALELLWQRADRVTVRMESYRSSPRRLEELIGRAKDVARVDAAATQAEIAPLRVRDARLRKRQDRLFAAASLSESDLRRALPPGLEVRPIASGAGELLLDGRFEALGVEVRGRARVGASDGDIVVRPVLPLRELATVTLFSANRLAVTGVGAEPRPGGFRVTATGRLR